MNERCFGVLDAPVQRLAGLDMSTPFNGVLEAATIPQVADIVAAARALCRPQAAAKTAPAPAATTDA
jgi:pyruvate dehydrogenase E1 component beta subunit